MVTFQAPATVGNFGPGFDTLSLALHALGDTVTMEVAEKDRIRVEGPGDSDVPERWDRNVAGVVIDELRNATGVQEKFEVTLEKPRGTGTGLGSSASSAGGAALGFAALAGRDLEPKELVQAAWAAEKQAGGGNPDDVAAVIQGGLSWVSVEGRRLDVGRIEPPDGLHLAVAVPDLRLETTAMRAILPSQIPREDVVWNLGRVVRLIDACHRNDVGALGAVLGDRIALPARLAMLPHYDVAHEAAIDAGAPGVCLSGSGPSMVAVAGSRGVAAQIANAMSDAIEDQGTECMGLVAEPEREVMHALALS